MKFHISAPLLCLCPSPNPLVLAWLPHPLICACASPPLSVCMYPLPSHTHTKKISELEQMLINILKQDLGLKCQTPFKSQSFGCFCCGLVKQSQFLRLGLALETNKTRLGSLVIGLVNIYFEVLILSKVIFIFRYVLSLENLCIFSETSTNSRILKKSVWWMSKRKMLPGQTHV